MSADFTTFPPSKRFGIFVGEVCAKVGGVAGFLAGHVATKIQNIENPTVRKVCGFFREHQDNIAFIAYCITAAYNFYTNALFFVAGTATGFVASASSFPVDFRTLRQGELCGHTRERGFAGPVTMASLGFLNLYLGNTALDNAFFAGTGGLLFGNSMYHKFKSNAMVEGVTNFLGSSGNYVRALPFVVKVFGEATGTPMGPPSEEQRAPTECG